MLRDFILRDSTAYARGNHSFTEDTYSHQNNYLGQTDRLVTCTCVSFLLVVRQQKTPTPTDGTDGHRFKIEKATCLPFRNLALH